MIPDDYEEAIQRFVYAALSADRMLTVLLADSRGDDDTRVTPVKASG
jgi:hypothetical protein